MGPLPVPDGPVPVFDIVDICQEAADRAGVEFRSGYALQSARRSIQLLQLDWANRGLNLWTVDHIPVPLLAGIFEYPLPADTVDALDVSLETLDPASSQPLARYGMGDYHDITNRLSAGPPSVFYVRRLTARAHLCLWQTPNRDNYWVVRVWRLRHMLPVPRSGDGMLDLPLRFVPAMIAGLAFHLAMKSKIPATAQRAPALQQLYEAEFDMATQEDRDRKSFFLVPDTGGCGC